MIPLAKLAEIRKALIAFAGFLGVVASSGLLPASASGWVSSVLAGLAAIGVHQVRNTNKAPLP